jgi:hypothetical protein
MGALPYESPYRAAALLLVGISSHLITPARGNPSSITMQRRGEEKQVDRNQLELLILISR